MSGRYTYFIVQFFVICLFFSSTDSHYNGVFAETKDCIVAVRIFDTDICEKDLAISNTPMSMPSGLQMQDHGHDHSHDQDHTHTADESRTPFHTLTYRQKSKRLEALEGEIWRIAIENRFPEQDFNVTDAELSAYLSAMDQTLNAGFYTNIKAKEKIQTMLKENSYAPHHEKQLKDILATLTKGIEYFQAKQQSLKNMPQELTNVRNKAQEDYAKKAIRTWKENKALFEAYGGDLSLDDTQAVPIDAYTTIIDWISKNGNLTTQNDLYRTVLDVQKNKLKDMRRLEKDKYTELYDQYFTAPEWYLVNKTTHQNFKQFEIILNNIPALAEE